MAIKLADTLAPMADFPAVMAEHTAFEDGETLQEKYETGQLGGGGGGYTQLSQAEYDALTDDEKMDGREYRTYDTGHIYKLGIEYGKEDAIYTSLAELGLTAPITVGEIFNAMPNKTMAILSCEDIANHITDVPTAYGVLTIKKNGVGRFSIEYQNSTYNTPCNVKKWIGTLKGADGTGLYWKQLSAEPTFITLNDIGLTADATFQDVINKLPKGGSVLLGVKEFTNYQTIFPYEDGNDQFARVYIVKGVADGSSMYARWFRKDGVKEAIAIFNINDNKFVGWRMLRDQQTYTSLSSLGLTADATPSDIVRVLPIGGKAIISTHEFTNYQTIFPYSDETDKYATFSVDKGSDIYGSRTIVKWVKKDASKIAYGGINTSNQVAWWNEYVTKNYVDSLIADLQAQINALK